MKEGKRENKRMLTKILILLASTIGICFGSYDCISNCACWMEENLLVANCSSRNFKEVPVPRKFQINVLLLGFNKLTTLRKNAFVLHEALKIVDLSGNGMRFIEVGALQPFHRSKLEVMDLSHNSLREIPSSDLRGLSDSLTNLSLSYNAFRRFPDLSEMSRLVDFDISYNFFITSIPEGFLPFSLLSLNVDNTFIKKYTKGCFSNATSIRRLILSNNKASANLDFDEGVFDRLIELQHLDLSGSYCKRLMSDSFIRLRNLSSLLLRSSYSNNLPVFQCVLEDYEYPVDEASHQAYNMTNEEYSGQNIKPPTKTSGSIEPTPPPSYEWCNPHLQILDLSHNRDLSLPQNLTHDIFPPSLSTLDISYTTVSLVRAETFSNMKKLRSLDLCYSRISKMATDAFFGLRSLTSICLSGNRFRVSPRLPRGIEEIEMSQAAIKVLNSASVGSMRRLLKADWSGGTIERIQEYVFANATLLRSLNLSTNAITFISEHTFSIGNTTSGSSLEQLDLSSNSIEGINGPAFKSHGNLTLLLLQKNQIVEISDATLSGLVNVKVLNLGGNVLVDVTPKALKDLRHLEDLTLDDNELEVIYHNLFSHSPCLKKLSVARNRLLEMHHQFLPSLQSLNLRENNLTTIPRVNASRMIALDVSDNQISMITSETLSGVPLLRDLNIAFNDLNNVNSSVFQLIPHLEKLHMAACSLQQFVNYELPSVKVLILRENEISDFKFPLDRNLPSIERLDISFNNLATVNSSFLSSSKSLRSIDLKGNNFNCDCNLLGLVQWIDNSSNSIDVVGADAYTCESPPEFYSQLIMMEVKDLSCPSPTPKPQSKESSLLIVLLCLSGILLIMIVLSLLCCRKRREERLMSSSSTSSLPSTSPCSNCFGSSFHRENGTTSPSVFSDDETHDLMAVTSLPSPTTEGPELL